MFAFGRHRDVPVDDVARSDPDYLRWLTKQDFLADFLGIIHGALSHA